LTLDQSVVFLSQKNKNKKNNVLAPDQFLSSRAITFSGLCLIHFLKFVWRLLLMGKRLQNIKRKKKGFEDGV